MTKPLMCRTGCGRPQHRGDLCAECFLLDTTEEPREYTGLLCPQCGEGVSVDEEGLCVGCGCTAVGKGVEEILNERDAAAKAEVTLREVRDLIAAFEEQGSCCAWTPGSCAIVKEIKAKVIK